MHFSPVKNRRNKFCENSKIPETKHETENKYHFSLFQRTLKLKKKTKRGEKLLLSNVKTSEKVK